MREINAMAIKFGPGGKPRLTQLAPANLGRATEYFPAQQELDHVVGRANAQYEEAIRMDGIDVHYWRRGREGRFCTCQARAGFRAENADGPPHVDPVAPPSFRVRGGDDLFETRPNPSLVIGAGSPFGGLRLGDLPEAEQGNAADDDGVPEQTLEDWITRPADDVDEADFLSNPDAGIVFGGERTPCAICFKTGFVGGYQLLQGQRIILDSGDEAAQMRGFDLDTEPRPFEFTSPHDPRTAVEWELELPTYFTALAAATVRRNLGLCRDLALEFRTPDNATWRTVDADAFAAYRGTPTTVRLRVRPLHRRAEGLARFSHVELVFQTAPWTKVQMGALDKTTSYGVFKGAATRTATFTVGPSLPGVQNEDVLYDTKYGILWKVTSVTDFMTAGRQVCGWQVQAREIHSDEMTYLLKMSAIPYVELNYAGPEAMQGAGIVREDRFKAL